MLGIPAREALSHQLGLTDVQASKLVFRLDVRAARALAMTGRDVFDRPLRCALFFRPSVTFAARRTRLEAKRPVVCAPASTFFDHFILNTLTYK